MPEKKILLAEDDFINRRLIKNVYRTRSTIRLMLKKLPESTFVQVHRAYIVNGNKIEKYKQKKIYL